MDETVKEALKKAKKLEKLNADSPEDLKKKETEFEKEEKALDSILFKKVKEKKSK